MNTLSVISSSSRAGSRPLRSSADRYAGAPPAATAAIAAAFADAGYGAPHIFTVHPSQGARRDA
mgnify:CR=1 FL=1